MAWGIKSGSIGAAVVFVLSVAAFIRASGYGLVNFDDYLYVERIPAGPGGYPPSRRSV